MVKQQTQPKHNLCPLGLLDSYLPKAGTKGLQAIISWASPLGLNLKSPSLLGEIKHQNLAITDWIYFLT